MNTGLGVERHARSRQVQPPYGGNAPNPRQDGIDGGCGPVAVAEQLDALELAFHNYLDDLCVQVNLDTIARQRIGDHLRGVALLFGQEQWFAVRDDGSRAETAKCLRQFAAERTTTDDEQAGRTRRQVEHGLVGQESGVSHARNRRQHGPRPGRDHGPPELQPGPADIDRIRPREACAAKVDVDACGGQSCRRIDAAEAEADASHALHRGCEVDLDVRRRHGAEILGGAHLGNPPRSAQQRLRWDAAEIQAVAAQLMAFNHRDLGTARCGVACRRQASRSGTDD